jgi:hypothetical protein
MLILKKAINSQYKYLLKGMWKWDKNFFKDFFPALLEQKTSIMKKISLNTKRNMNKTYQRNSHFLAKESFAPLQDKIEKRCFSLVWEVTDNDYICIDEVDIAKPTAKLMEWIAKVRDASRKTIVNWFIFHWASIKWIPVIMQQEDLTNKFKCEYFWKLIEKLIKFTKWKWVYVLDALYDIAAYLDFMNDKWVKYIIRAKKNRWYFDMKTQNKLKLKDFKDGVYEVKIVNVKKTVFLHIKTNKKFPEPIRILSNNRNTNTEEYAKRWEIETIFKTMKQEFEMEKIQAGTLQVLNNIVSIIMLAVALTKSIYDSSSWFKWTTLFQWGTMFTNRFKKWSKHQWLTMNKNSIISFISDVIQGMYKNHRKWKKKWINRKPWIKAQLKLFTMVEL